MNKKFNPTLVFTMAIAMVSNSCYWCGQSIQECGTCGGSGVFNDSPCKACKGNGRLCPTHEGNWAG